VEAVTVEVTIALPVVIVEPARVLKKPVVRTRAEACTVETRIEEAAITVLTMRVEPVKVLKKPAVKTRVEAPTVDVVTVEPVRVE